MTALKLTCLSCGQVNRTPDDRIATAICAACKGRLVSDAVNDIGPSVLSRAIANDELPLIVDFWAPWCGPCRIMSIHIAQAAQELCGKVRIVKLNTEDHPATGSRFNIRTIPTMVAFGGGRELSRKSGALQKAHIVQWASQWS